MHGAFSSGLLDPLRFWRRSVAVAVVLALAVLRCSDHDDAGLLAGGRAYPLDPPHGQAVVLDAADIAALGHTLRLGVTPYANDAQTRKDLAPLVTHLSAVLGIPVELVTSTTYGALVASTVDGDVDVAMLSPLSYVQARQLNPAIELAARAVSQGSPEYAAYLVVRMNDTARSLADLKGRRMAWVDPLSASGYLYPRRVLVTAQYDPDKLFGEQKFYGTHDAALQAVLDGHADVAAVASGALARACRPQDNTLANAIRVLHKCGRLPYDAVAVRAGMSRSAVTKIGWAFEALSNRSEDGRRILSGTWAISGWIPADDSVYDGVRSHLLQVPGLVAPVAVTLADLATEAGDVR